MALNDLLGRDGAGVIVGGAEVFLGAWATGGTTGTTFSAGYTRGDSIITPNYELTDIESEQTVSPVLTFISGAKLQIEFELLQNNLQNMRLAMAQAVAALTGTANGQKLVFNEPVLEYLQLKFVAPGPGTGTTHAGTKVDTYEFWRCLMRASGGIPFGKKIAQSIKCVASILPDSTSDTTKGVYGVRNLA